MKRLCFIIPLVFIFSCNQNQDNSKSIKENRKKEYFSNTKAKISKYREDANVYYAKGDIENGDKYDDSIRNTIKGTYIDDYTFYEMDSTKYLVKNTDKPILLLATATWCPPCKSEIPALNKISKEYSDKIDIVLLFWDNPDRLKKVVDDYEENIILIPSNKEKNNSYELSISGFNHILGFPTRYLVNQDKRIINYYSGASQENRKFTNENGEEDFLTEKEAFDRNYSKLKEEVNELLSGS